jgi:hypothetical protein
MFNLIVRLIEANSCRDTPLFGSLEVDRSQRDVPASLDVQFMLCLEGAMKDTKLYAGKHKLQIPGATKTVYFIVPAALAPLVWERMQEWAVDRDFRPMDGSPLSFMEYAMFNYDQEKMEEYMPIEEGEAENFRKGAPAAWLDLVSHMFWTLDPNVWNEARAFLCI